MAAGMPHISQGPSQIHMQLQQNMHLLNQRYPIKPAQKIQNQRKDGKEINCLLLAWCFFLAP